MSRQLVIKNMIVTVKAKENSTGRTPITGALAGTYTPGALVRVRCSLTDEWEVAEGEGYEANANGVKTHFTTRGNQIFQSGSMVGSWDGGKTFFPVGTQLDMIVLAAIPGNPNLAELTLYCWDSDFENNSGTIKADVTVTSPPFNI